MSDEPEDLLIWQYRGKPKARQNVGLLFGESKDGWQSVQAVGEMLNIDTATGYALDLVGRHVGFSRTLKTFVRRRYFGWRGVKAALGFAVTRFYRYGDALADSTRLSDGDYRFLLKAKVLKNTQRPTLEGIIAVVGQLLGEEVHVIDQGNMTMEIFIPETSLSEIQRFAVRTLDILPRPVGVTYIFTAL